MISIVMPVYNTGKYLEESIKSILLQSYTDFELICVDDCSRDKLTKEILCKYSEEDSRIKVLALERNVGAAEARNIGATHATGTYITFLDGDDVFHKDMLKKIYITIEKYDADMCVWGFRTFCNNGFGEQVLDEISLIKEGNITDTVFELSDLSENGMNLWNTSPWTKLCKRSFLIDNNISFQSLKCANDVYYSLLCAIYAKKIVYVEGEQILVDYRTGSSNQISSNRDPRCVCDAIEKILKRVNMDAHLKAQIASAFLGMMKYEFNSSSDDRWREESYYRLRGMLKEYFCDVVFEDNTYNVLKKKIEEEDYSCGQFFLSGDFEGQLRGVQDELKKEISDIEDVVVWGNGKRGKAFLNILDLFDCKSVMIVDTKNDSVGMFAENEVPIMHTDKVKGKNCVIIATNNCIYNDIKDLDDYKKAKIINLERYCPVG